MLKDVNFIDINFDTSGKKHIFVSQERLTVIDSAGKTVATAPSTLTIKEKYYY